MQSLETIYKRFSNYGSKLPLNPICFSWLIHRLLPDWSKFINNINAEDKNNSEVIVAVKDLCNFCRTLEVSLIKFENNVTLNWSASCGISNVPGAIAFPVTDTKLYDSVVTPSTQYNTNLLSLLLSSLSSLLLLLSLLLSWWWWFELTKL